LTGVNRTNSAVSEMPGGQTGENGVVFLQNGIRETARRGAQQKKKFTCPQQDVQQAATLKIVEVFAMQGNIQSSPGTFFYERTESSEVERETARALASRVDALQVFVTELNEVV